jgi:hypothetical protein
VSVDSGVAWCGSSADATTACWKSRQPADQVIYTDRVTIAYFVGTAK